MAKAEDVFMCIRMHLHMHHLFFFVNMYDSVVLSPP